MAARLFKSPPELISVRPAQTPAAQSRAEGDGSSLIALADFGRGDAGRYPPATIISLFAGSRTKAGIVAQGDKSLAAFST